MSSIAPAATPIPQAAIIGGSAPMAANVAGAPMAAMPTATQQLPTVAAPQGTLPMDAAAGAAALPKPPSAMGTIIKHALAFGIGGAALGAGVSLLGGVLPFTLPFTLPIMAAIGGAVGVVAGVISGIRSVKKQGAAYEQALAAAQLQAAQAQQPPAGSNPPTETGSANAAGSAMGTHENPPAAGVRRYRIRRGDTLSAIGKRTGTDWHAIYAANKGVIGRNPNMIHVGAVLTIPTAS